MAAATKPQPRQQDRSRPPQGQPNGNRPFQVIRRGLLKVVIWENQTTNGSMFSTQLIRVYKDGEDWKETFSLNREDLLHAAKMLDAADSIIHRTEEERRDQKDQNGNG